MDGGGACVRVHVCECPDYLVLSIGQPAASQSDRIEAGSRTGVAAWKQERESHQRGVTRTPGPRSRGRSHRGTNKAPKITALSYNFGRERGSADAGVASYTESACNYLDPLTCLWGVSICED